MSSTRRQRLLAYALGGMGPGSNALIYFLVPLRAADLEVGFGVIGVLLGVKALTETALAIPLGSFIDRVGARRAFLAGTAGVAVAGACLMVAESLAALIVLQVLLGATRPLAWVGGQSYVSGMRSGADRSYDTGRFSFAASFSQIIAPLIAGSAFQYLGAGTAFVTLVLYGVVFFVVGIGLPDAGRRPRGAESTGTGLRAAARLLRSADMQVVMLLTFTRLWTPSAWNAFLPLFLISVGTPASIAGTAASCMALVATVTSLFAGRIARWGRASVVTAVGLGISCLGVALTPLAVDVPLVYLPAAMVGIGQGISLPMLLVLVSAAAPPGQRSLALGLRSGVNQGAATAAPLAIAPMVAIGGLGLGFPLAGAIGAAALVAAMVVELASSRKRAAASQAGGPGPR